MRAPTTRQRLAAIAGRIVTTVLAVLATVLFSYLLLHAGWSRRAHRATYPCSAHPADRTLLHLSLDRSS